MRKHLKKPYDLSTRQTAAALSRINNCLPLFPDGSEESKFTPAEELLDILECSLPQAWRHKFDYDGYVPTDGDRATLITACEAIERSLESTTGDKKQKQQQGKKEEKTAKKKHNNAKHESKGSKGEFYCSEHGKNGTHNTASCYTLKNRAKAEGKQPAKKEFSNKGLCKEINMMAKDSSKEKVLDMYASVIAKEKAKLSRSKTGQTVKREPESDSESDSSSDASMALIECTSEMDRDDADHKLSDEELEFLSMLHNNE